MRGAETPLWLYATAWNTGEKMGIGNVILTHLFFCISPICMSQDTTLERNYPVEDICFQEHLLFTLQSLVFIFCITFLYDVMYNTYWSIMTMYKNYAWAINPEEVCGQRLCLCSFIFPWLCEETGKYLAALRNKEII